MKFIRNLDSRIVLIVIVAGMFGGFAIMGYAQEPATTKPADTIPRLDGGKSVFMIVCDESPDKYIVLDQDGKWLPTVKNAQIRFDLGKAPMMTCTMYSGIYVPTNPDVKMWRLAQMRSVSMAEFQRTIDSLQSNPSLTNKLPNAAKPAAQ